MSFFNNKDFECFHPSKTKNSEYNNERLEVRRKLEGIGKKILPLFEEIGCKFTMKTSLHHPFIHNQYRVTSQWVYFGPSAQNIKELKKIFGSAFFDELKSGYNHTVLLIGIDYEGIFIGLKTHAKAWWDGQNLKNKCASVEARREFHQILNNVQKFQLKIHDFKKIYHCGNISLDDLNMFLKYYSPGEHWIHLDYAICRQDSFLTQEDLQSTINSLLISLIPVYNFIRWSPQNDYVFKKKNAD